MHIDADHAISALSTRMVALEAAIAALSQASSNAQRLKTYDLFAREALDRFKGLAVSVTYLKLLEHALADVRMLMDHQMSE